MNCYYHPNSPAVAQCRQCGRFLCRECADKYEGILCDDCVRKNLEEQENMRLAQENAQQMQEAAERNNFAKKCLYAKLLFWGSLVYFTITVVSLLRGDMHFRDILRLIPTFLCYAFVIAGTPFGLEPAEWGINAIKSAVCKILGENTRVILPIIFIIALKMVLFFTKYAAALMIGWFFMLRLIVKSVINKYIKKAK